MILRGPGASYVRYEPDDVRVMEELQKTGEELLPFYTAMVIFKDLYTVHGGEVNWAYEGLGITAFTNELWSDAQMYSRKGDPSEDEVRKFRDLLQFSDVYVPYREFDHPTLGKVLIGGTKKYSSRVTPPWLLEEGCHRNFAFTMYHADQMPQVQWGLSQVKAVPGSGLWEVTVEVKNPKIIPSILGQARRNDIGARDRITCTPPPDGAVVASGTVQSLLPNARLDAVERSPARIWNDAGIPGRGSRLFRFLVQGNGSIELEYSSQKGGTIRKSVELKATE
jgi:hypothetical protein